MNVGNPLENAVSLFNTVQFILVKNLMSVVNVGSFSAFIPASLDTREFTLEKSHMSVVNVGNPLHNALILFNTVEYILEKSLMSVVNVGNTLAIPLTSFNTREFTVEKILKCAGICFFFSTYYKNTGGDVLRAIYLNLNLF